MKVRMLKDFQTEKGHNLRANTKGYIEDDLAIYLIKEGFAKAIVSVSIDEISETTEDAKTKLRQKKVGQA